MTAAEQASIIDKVTEIIKEIPTSIDLVKKGGDEQQRFAYLARYLVQKALRENALLVSRDGNGVAILFRTSKKESSFWKDWWEELKLVYHVTGFRKALSLLKTQRYNKSQLPDEGEYLYCWFWGIVKDARGTTTSTAREMKDEFIRIAQETQLPIYAETRMHKNALVYQRYGFKVFHTWDRPDGDTAYFLKYTPLSE
jgi:hypothetical protein